MNGSRFYASPGLDSFLAAILDKPDRASAAAFAVAILDEGESAGVAAIYDDRDAANAAFAATILREYDPNEPRDWRGRWTTGRSDGSPRGATDQPGQKSEPGVQVEKGKGGFTAKDLLDELGKHDDAKKLLKDAENAVGKPINIRLITGLGPGGSEATDGSQEVGKQTVKTAAGDIIIDPDQEVARALDTLVFELLNLTQAATSRQLRKELDNGEVSQNQYILRVKMIEDRSLYLRNQMYSSVQNFHPKLPDDLERVYRGGAAAQIESAEKQDLENAEVDVSNHGRGASDWSKIVVQHKGRYEDQWNQMYRKQYGEKHPLEPLPPVRKR